MYWRLKSLCKFYCCIQRVKFKQALGNIQGLFEVYKATVLFFEHNLPAMKKKLIILSIFCFTAFAACEPDRRTAQNEGYPAEEELDDEITDFEPGIQEVNATEGLEIQREFVHTAFSGNLMEVELGRMAQQQAKSQQVKDLGQMLMQDHRQANDKLQTIAQNKNIEVPATTMAEMHQEKVEELRGLSGSEFDKKYVSLMIEAHQNAIQRFESAQNELQDTELKQWVSNTLETLRKHKERIEQVNSKIGQGS